MIMWYVGIIAWWLGMWSAVMPAPAEEGCAPAVVAEWILTQRPGLHNWRAVAPERIADAVEIFAAAAPAVPKAEWTAAWLIGAEDGGGVLLVGYPDQVCASVKMPSQHWYAATKMLEGVRI